MKTKLLLLFALLNSALSFSQISFFNLTSSNITNTTATVSVTLSNLCTPSQYRLQYSTSSTFLAGTIEVVYSTVNNGLKSHNLTGLLANTPYYFRFYVSSGDACNSTQIVSATANFTTTNATLPSITVDSLTDVFSTSATINYTVNSNGAPTTSTLYYGIAPNWNNLSVTGISVPSGQSSGQIVLSGLTPNTNYSYRFIANNYLGESVTAISTFQTTPIQLTFSSLASSAITSSSATVSVTLGNVCAGSSYRLQYSTFQMFDGTTVDTQYSTGGTNGIKNHNLTGLTPNTTYYFRFYASPNQACNTAQIVSAIASFTTSDNPALIAEYNFNNTYNNVNGNTPFTSNTGTSFTTDRNGNVNSALNLVSIGTNATIPNLPYGSSPRTISIWVKNYSYNSFVASACPFSYGTISNTYEITIFETSFRLNPYSSLNQSHYVDLTPLSITNALNVWSHYVVSYDGTTSKIYKDGVLLSSLNVAIIPTSNNSDIFKLGLLNAFTSDYFDGAIDDLKIYNYALGQADITSLFTNNSLSSQNFNQNNLEVALYPNPVNNVLNIETALEVQSVEIYNIQGQKVLSSNQKQINTQNLSAGIYLVNITDTNNNKISKKIIKK